MSAKHPTPWTFSADNEFEDVPIRDRNGNYVLVRDSGAYPPDLDTCREIVEAVNERDRLREELDSVNAQLNWHKRQLEAVRADAESEERWANQYFEQAQRAEAERDRILDLVRRLADNLRRYHILGDRDNALLREAREALGEAAP